MRYALIAAAIFYPSLSAASSFERFDVPGATATCGTAIASNGLVAGVSYVGTVVIGDAASRAATPGGFLYRSGRFFYLKPAVPAGFLNFTGVNRARAVTGNDIDSASLAIQTFTYAAGVTTFPAITQGTVDSLAGINDSFTILGQATVAGPPPFNTAYVGFLRTSAGAVTIIDDGSGSANPTGMDNRADYIVGTSLTSNGGGWVFHNGTFTPIAFPGGSFTIPDGVDSKGNVAGIYITGTSPSLVEHGFRLRKGVYTTWDVPGADDTAISGVNEIGQLTGCFTKNGKTHGFIYTP